MLMMNIDKNDFLFIKYITECKQLIEQLNIAKN